MSFIKDDTRFYIIGGHNKSWASAMDVKDYIGEVSGVVGEKGEDGKDGDSAYQLAVKSGYTGTVAQWLASLKGEQGIQGLRGPQGLRGLQGEQGVRGDQGPQGLQGNMGLQGEQGLKGEKGDTGEQGPRGMQGEVGPQGPQGIQGPQGVQGPKGDTGNGFSLTKVYPSVADMEADATNPNIPENSFVLINSADEDNGKLYVKHGGAYVYQSQLAGVKGDKGDQGEQGPQGIQGPKGDTGARGEEGIQGPKGDKGDVGQQGLAGPQGPRGIQGIQGEQGLKGDTGDKGDQGEQGPQGPRGIQGPKGDTPVIPEKEYLHARRGSSGQTLSNNGRVIFNYSDGSRGITLNTTTGGFNLKAGKTYRITADLRLNFSTTNGRAEIFLVNNSGNVTPSYNYSDIRAIPNTGNAASNGVLDLIITPTSTQNYFIQASNFVGEPTVVSNFSRVIIVEI